MSIISKWLHLILLSFPFFLAILTRAEYDFLCLKNVKVIKFLISRSKQTYFAKIKYLQLACSELKCTRNSKQEKKRSFNLPDKSDLGKKVFFSKRGSFNPRLVRGPFYSFLGGLFVAIKYYYCESPTSLAFLNLIFVELFYPFLQL